MSIFVDKKCIYLSVWKVVLIQRGFGLFFKDFDQIYKAPPLVYFVDQGKQMPGGKHHECSKGALEFLNHNRSQLRMGFCSSESLNNRGNRRKFKIVALRISNFNCSWVFSWKKKHRKREVLIVVIRWYPSRATGLVHQRKCLRYTANYSLLTEQYLKNTVFCD